MREINDKHMHYLWVTLLQTSSHHRSSRNGRMLIHAEFHPNHNSLQMPMVSKTFGMELWWLTQCRGSPEYTHQYSVYPCLAMPWEMKNCFLRGLGKLGQNYFTIPATFHVYAGDIKCLNLAFAHSRAPWVYIHIKGMKKAESTIHF